VSRTSSVSLAGLLHGGRGRSRSRLGVSICSRGDITESIELAGRSHRSRSFGATVYRICNASPQLAKYCRKDISRLRNERSCKSAEHERTNCRPLPTLMTLIFSYPCVVLCG